MCFQITTEIKDDSPLSDIGESVVKTELDLLREIADEPLRMRCLESFCRSCNLMEWIRTETASKFISCSQHSLQKQVHGAAVSSVSLMKNFNYILLDRHSLSNH